LLAACALLVVLAWQNRQLREERRWFVTRTTEPYLGMYVPKIAATALDGSALTLGVPAGDYQVLFFFTTTCPYCKRSAPTVVQAAQRLAAQGGRVQVLGVCQCSPDQTRRYAIEHRFPFPVTTLTERRALMLFRARNVPSMLALDRDGHLAAGTSTGGMTNKRYGRVGDAPIIGAGTYANGQCAVSGTGWGEFYIRAVAAYDICARMQYLKQGPVEAGRAVINERIPALGGDGGAIVLSADGRAATPFNTQGMYRGWIGADGVPHVAVFREDEIALPDGR
jgi:peroxiredoxin